MVQETDERNMLIQYFKLQTDTLNYIDIYGIKYLESNEKLMKDPIKDFDEETKELYLSFKDVMIDNMNENLSININYMIKLLKKMGKIPLTKEFDSDSEALQSLFFYMFTKPMEDITTTSLNSIDPQLPPGFLDSLNSIDPQLPPENLEDFNSDDSSLEDF